MATSSNSEVQEPGVEVQESHQKSAPGMTVAETDRLINAGQDPFAVKTGEDPTTDNGDSGIVSSKKKESKAKS